MAFKDHFIQCVQPWSTMIDGMLSGHSGCSYWVI